VAESVERSKRRSRFQCPLGDSHSLSVSRDFSADVNRGSGVHYNGGARAGRRSSLDLPAEYLGDDLRVFAQIATGKLVGIESTLPELSGIDRPFRRLPIAHLDDACHPEWGDLIESRFSVHYQRVQRPQLQ